MVCPGGQGDVSVYQQPAVHVGRGDARQDRLHADAGGRRHDALPRRPHLRHQQPRQPGARRRRADLPRLPHPHAGHRRGRPEERLHLRPGHGRPPHRGRAGRLRRASNTNTPTGADPSKWRIEVIKVPVAAPEDAEIVNDAAAVRGPGDRRGQRPPERRPDAAAPVGDRLVGPTPITDACHDITGVSGDRSSRPGACEGNGLLIDISDPANPKRIDAVADPLYAYWHGATFSNDGKTVDVHRRVGRRHAARAAARPIELSWGGNAIYDIVGGKLVFRSYYKIPAGPDRPGELRQPHPVAGPGPGPRHLRAGLVPGRRVAGRLQRLGAPGRDRLLRPRPDQLDGARARRPVVDLLVQRRDLRLGDRPRVRRLRA